MKNFWIVLMREVTYEPSRNQFYTESRRRVRMEWDFPSKGGGETDGFNNSSIDTFIGRRVFSLIRETIQNSMDARAKTGEAVKICFSLDQVKKVEAKGISELVPFLLLAAKTAESQHGGDHAGSKFFKRALDQIETSKIIPFFSIHDYQTTGLTGPTESGKEKPGAWLALVKGSGLSIKNAPGSLGSFGHGSKAPFAISQLRTVFYFSRIIENSKSATRFQGKSILQSMETQYGEMTQGTGYFGHKKKCMPLVDDEIPNWVSQLRDMYGNGTGTSLLVPFPELGTTPEDFWRDIKISVLSNFYYAIRKGNLEIGLGSQEIITSLNLNECLEDLLSEISGLPNDEAQDLREDLRSAITIQYPSIEKQGTLISKSFGEVEWYMRIGQDIDWRSVGVARQNGMLISRRAKNLEKFTGTKPFDMFLCVVGQNGSQTLRAAENPAHTEFEFDRITDPMERKNKLKDYSDFTREVRDLIRSHAAIDSSAEVFTADLDDFFGGFNTASNETGKSEKSLDLIVERPRKVSFSNSSPATIAENGDEDEMSDFENSKSNKSKKDVKKNKGSNGKAGGEKKSVGLEILDPRIVRSEQSNLVEIYFTPTVKSGFVFELYRSGDSEREPASFRVGDDKSWLEQLAITEISKVKRIHLSLELHPEEKNYVHEVVIHLAK